LLLPEILCSALLCTPLERASLPPARYNPDALKASAKFFDRGVHSLITKAILAFKQEKAPSQILSSTTTIPPLLPLDRSLYTFIIYDLRFSL
jgi:hypothetical protein